MLDESEGQDVLAYFEEALDEATTILIRAADRRGAFLDLCGAARSAYHELGVQRMTAEEFLEYADADPLRAGEIRALIDRATRKEDER